MEGEYLFCFFIESPANPVDWEDFVRWEEDTARLSEALHEIIHGPVLTPLTGMNAVWMPQETDLSDFSQPEIYRERLMRGIREGSPLTIIYSNFLIPRESRNQMLEESVHTYEGTREHGKAPLLLKVGQNHPYPIMDDLYTEQFRRMIEYLKEGEVVKAQTLFSRLAATYRFGQDVQYNRHLFSLIISSVLAMIQMKSSYQTERVLDSLQHSVIAETWTRFVLGEMERNVRQRDMRMRGYRLTFAEKVALYIDADISNPELDLKTASARFGLTPQYFSAKFKEEMKINFNTYIEELRMQMAYTLLTEQSLSVNDTARACGYENTGTFRRVFKNRFSVCPSEAGWFKKDGT